MIAESLRASLRVIRSDCIARDSIAREVANNASMGVVDALGGDS
jgi:hypothetical protein